MIEKVQKKHVFALLLVVLMGVSACHKNPVTKSRPDKAARVLLHASRAAEKALNFDPQNGWMYPNCMEDNRARIDCAAFFKVMLTFVTKNDGFKRMTYDDLADKKAFEPIADNYDIAFFKTDE